jgi:hypothetical protein
VSLVNFKGSSLKPLEDMRNAAIKYFISMPEKDTVHQLITENTRSQAKMLPNAVNIFLRESFHDTDIFR